jgi:patatin-related protein
MPQREVGGRRQLRLGVVCYGGVSLCIYMHGITKELHRLVRASRLPGDPAPTTTESVYREVLARAAERDHVEREVVVDVIAGTSAGGINGIYLAKALAHNLRQDALRDLWLERGDIKGLTRGPTWVPLGVRAPFLLGQLDDKPPLRGREMSVWLYDALRSMDEEGPSPPDVATLMPEGHVLQLYVTMTDLQGYDRELVLSDPKAASDRSHRHVFQFRHGDGEDLFTSDHNLALTFAARATSCFPGAFPPVSVELLKSYLPGARGDIHTPFFRIYELSGAPVARRYFVDGGVLDNRPFGRVIEAIREKRADVEVDRRLLFIEPDPKLPARSGLGEDEADDDRRPGPLSTVLATVAGVPRRQPILDQLMEVNRLTERVRRVRDVIEARFDDVGDRVEGVLQVALSAVSAPDPGTVAEWQKALNAAAQSDAGVTHTTYLRSKISGVVDGLARTACDVCDYPTESNHAGLVRTALRCWAERASLFAQNTKPSTAQVDFLRDFDLDYGIRRLQFVLAGVNWWYAWVHADGYPTRPQLDVLKARLWRAIDDLRAARSGERFPAELVGEVRACFPVGEVASYVREHGFDGDGYAQRKRADLTGLTKSLRSFLNDELDGFSLALYRDVDRLSGDWEPARRRDLLVRYLGFPLWDVLVHPVQSAGDAGERDAVEVIRMSPLDSKLLSPADGGAKLKGVGLGHFAAFFERRYRENDYLWGRLDAAERIVWMLLGDRDPEYASWCARAFRAVLDEEEPVLRSVSELIGRLRQEVESLAGVPITLNP